MLSYLYCLSSVGCLEFTCCVESQGTNLINLCYCCRGEGEFLSSNRWPSFQKCGDNFPSNKNVFCYIPTFQVTTISISDLVAMRSTLSSVLLLSPKQIHHHLPSQIPYKRDFPLQLIKHKGILKIHIYKEPI